jgi:CRISPR-associated protein Cmr5
MNKRIEKWIPSAIKAIEKSGIVKADGTIPKEYNGYISSFGAAVMQSGLKAAIAFNENTESGSVYGKSPLMRAILEIMNGEPPAEGATLLAYVLSNDTIETKSAVLDATIALKLAIRTFKLVEGDA